MERPPVWVYLDNKVPGAIAQVTQFFGAGVFSRERVRVLFRDHRQISAVYRRRLEEAGVGYHAFRTPADYPDLEGAVVCYPFNAQSNCRIAAERQARHVFVTHGESNKAASVKPLIRVYDYVVTAGMAGVDRYLGSGIFTPDDVAGGRLVRLGDTFVRRSGFRPAQGGADDWVLYAPTWEGGLESENYSSLASSATFRHVASYARAAGLRRIAVQPHPNLGHRLPGYLQAWSDGLAWLAREGFELLVLGGVNPAPARWSLLGRRRAAAAPGEVPASLHVRKAFVDLSAMEVQLLNDGIECGVFLRAYPPVVRHSPLLAAHYAQAGILDWQAPAKLAPEEAQLVRQVRDYYVSYSQPGLAGLSFDERVEWLADYARTDPHWRQRMPASQLPPVPPPSPSPGDAASAAPLPAGASAAA